MKTRTYFAATDSKGIGEALVKRLETVCKDTSRDGTAEYENAYRHYYGQDSGFGMTTGVTRAGEFGELAQLRVNKARALAKAFCAIITGPKNTWRPQARNGDANAAKATTLSINLMDDEWKKRGLNRHYLIFVEQAIVFSQAYSFARWNRGMGPPLMPNGQNLIMQGDIEHHNILPWDRKVDPSLKSADSSQWEYVRLYENRWDLAKLYTKLADGREGTVAEDAILAASESKEVRDFDVSGRCDDDSDLVPVWYFFHKPSPALPLGREVVFINSQTVLQNSRLTYDGSPIIRLAADEKFDTPNAWSPYWDTLASQEIMDGIETTLATILTTMGNPVIAVEKGGDQKPDDLASGFRTWTYAKGGNKPDVMQHAVFPEKALDYLDMQTSSQRSMMGLNDVALGQPESAQMNAQAFAVLASMATQQAAPFMQRCIEALGKIGSSVLHTRMTRTSKPRMLQVTGQSSKHLYSELEYVGSDLKPVNGVVVEIGNPSEQSAAGRGILFDKLMTIPGAITSPEQGIQVLETGKLDPAVRGTRDELQLIASEYEMLSRGEAPPVHAVQNHPLHYRENAAALHNLDALKNLGVIQAVQQHLDAHYLEQFGVEPSADPMRLERTRFLLGHGPEPMPMAPPMPGGPAGAPPPPDGAPADVMAAPHGSPELAAMPEMPPNPMTGQPFNMADGGGVVAPV